VAKYDALKLFLFRQKGTSLTMSFADVSEIAGGLPNSAFNYREWWSNEPAGGHVQAHAWMAAGWSVDSVNLSSRVVTFRPHEGA
jgi:hypothetical protein